MTNNEIIEKLGDKFNAFTSFLENQEDALFDQPIAPGKWTFGQHAEHILISTRLLNQAMKMPKLALRATFGIKNERPERSYEEVVKKYRSKLDENREIAANTPGTRYAPGEIGTRKKSDILEKLEKEFSAMKKQTGKWKEEHLTKYLIPHPLIGKMTVREILYFTIYHTGHHLVAMKEAN